jgi:hypothetical protein
MVVAWCKCVSGVSPSTEVVSLKLCLIDACGNFSRLFIDMYHVCSQR